MNEPRARHLVIAYAFPPYSDTSAVVAAKRVRMLGEPVDVISNDMSRAKARDDSLDEVVAGLVRRHAQLRTTTLFGGWASIVGFATHGLKRVQQWSQEEGGTPYESLYSRAHYTASHYLAALITLERPDLPWRAEFSDPLSRYATGARRPGHQPAGPLRDQLAAALAERDVHPPQDATVFEWAEYLAYTLADELVFTNEGQLAYTMSLIPEEEGTVRLRDEVARKAVVSGHPTLPEEFYRLHEPPSLGDPGDDVVHIGYFGMFYAVRGPETIMAALARLDPADRARLRLHVFTGQLDELAEAVRAAGVEDVVVAQPRLPFLDFLAACRSMDVLLAIDSAPVPGAPAHPFRLSKWSDYVGSGTPVWGITTEGSELSRQDLAYRCPLDHVTATMQVLTSIARGGRGVDRSHP